MRINYIKKRRFTLDKYFEKLELNKIIDIAEKYCVTEVGKSKIKSLEPSFNSLVVSHLLSETSQIINLINESGFMPISQMMILNIFQRH